MLVKNKMNLQNSAAPTSHPPTKLRAFKLSQEYFATIGITPKLAHQSCPLNGEILSGFLMLGAGLYCASAFIVHDAQTFAEYTQSVYTLSILIFIILNLLISISKVGKLFELIDMSDDLVNTREFECQD